MSNRCICPKCGTRLVVGYLPADLPAVAPPPPRWTGVSEEVRVEKILEHVAESFGTTARAMRGRLRDSEVVRARWVAIKLVRDHLGWSTPRLGRLLNRDHTSIMHALREVDRIAATDAAFAVTVESIESEVADYLGTSARAA